MYLLWLVFILITFKVEFLRERAFDQLIWTHKFSKSKAEAFLVVGKIFISSFNYYFILNEKIPIKIKPGTLEVWYRTFVRAQFWVIVLLHRNPNYDFSENQKEAQKLRRFVQRATQLQTKIQSALADIADTQLDARRVRF